MKFVIQLNAEQVTEITTAWKEEHQCYYKHQPKRMAMPVPKGFENPYDSVHAGHTVSPNREKEMWLTCGGNITIVDTVRLTLSYDGARSACPLTKEFFDTVKLLSYESSAPELQPWETVNIWMKTSSSETAKAVRDILAAVDRRRLNAEFTPKVLTRAAYLLKGKLQNGYVIGA